MAFRLGAQSLARLAGVHPLMVAVVVRAIELSSVDFSVLEGVRTPARQKALYAQGRTAPGPKVTWTLSSNHFVNPKTGMGHAVDLIPFPVDWEGPVRFPKFDAIAKAMFAAAAELGVKIRWGADWDMNGKPRERSSETDSPHFELVL